MRDTSALAMSHFQQAAVFYQQARYVEAIQYYLSGLEHDKSRYHIYADLAKAYEMVGKWEQALACLDIAFQLCPDSPTIIRRQARIREEKKFYEKLVAETDLFDHPSTKFIRTLQNKDLEIPQRTVEDEFLKLTVEPPFMPRTLWHICQLIVKTYKEVGTKFDCFPNRRILISIINSYDTSAQTDLPSWAGGCYDGHITIKYCADGEPELGVLLTLIRHEWTHLLVDHLTHGSCPVWLNEGLAQTIARPLFSYEKHVLQQADKESTLPTLSELNQPLSDFSTSRRKIAYLHSAAIVSAMIDVGGFHSIRKLLRKIDNGMPVEIAMKRIYGRGIIRRVTDI